MSDFLQNEIAVVADNGLSNSYRVDYELVNSKAYHDKFEGLTQHKSVNEGLYRVSAKILEHRSGTPYEDIAMLDAHTGEILVENNSAMGDMKFKSGLTHTQAERLNDMGRSFEILHNHPNSSPPSLNDIEWLFNRPLAVASNIICHDGTLYRMGKLKAIDAVAELLKIAFDDLQKRNQDWSRVQLEYAVVNDVVKTFCRRGYLEYVKR